MRVNSIAEMGKNDVAGESHCRTKVWNGYVSVIGKKGPIHLRNQCLYGDFAHCECLETRTNISCSVAVEMELFIRSLDWSKTSLGPISEWPENLKTTVGILLRSPRPHRAPMGTGRHHDLQ